MNVQQFVLLGQFQTSLNSGSLTDTERVYLLYLAESESLGTFDTTRWDQSWRSALLELVKDFKRKNPNPFLLINEKRKAVSGSNKEIIEYHDAVFQFYFLPNEEFLSKNKKRIEDYPNNPEFRNLQAEALKVRGKYIEASPHYLQAIRLEDNIMYKNNLFSSEYSRIQQYLRTGENEKAREHMSYLRSQTLFNQNQTWISILDTIENRVDDRQHLKNDLVNAMQVFKNELEGERKKIIETVGLFSAIVAFILATVSIGINYPFKEAIFFLIALGAILILFAITISLLFTTSKKHIFKDIRFYLLIFILVSMLGGILFQEC